MLFICRINVFVSLGITKLAISVHYVDLEQNITVNKKVVRGYVVKTRYILNTKMTSSVFVSLGCTK